jgi:hypothetical protein
VVEAILKDTRLVKIDDTWVLFYQDREYIRLPHAQSRGEAEQQIAEMLFLRKAIEAPKENHDTQALRLIPTQP